VTSPLRPFTTTAAISRAKNPAACAAAAFCCDRSANASWSARVTWNCSATSSPVSGMLSVPYAVFISPLTNRQPIVVSYTSAERENASLAFAITNGARVMLSTPPASISSASPARIARAAVPTASSPLPHSRLIVLPGTDAGSPASSTAIRATFRLSSPAWFAHPMMQSSSAAQSTPALRSRSTRIGCAARSSVLISFKAPA